MRVLYVCHTAAVSGAERTLLDLLAALPDTVEPVVASPPGPVADRVQALGVRWEAVPGTAGSLRLHPRHTPVALAELARAGAAVRRVARRVRPAVVHANSVRAGLIAGAVAPPVLTHVHDHLAPGPMTAVVGRALRVRSAGFLSISGWAEAGLAGRPVFRVGNPVDIGRFAPGGDAVDLPPGPRLGVVAQITPWKGQLEAVEALAVVRRAHPTARLVLAGEVKFAAASTRLDNHAYDRELRQRAAALGVADAIDWLGEREDVAALLRALDVLLVPSHGEPFGRAMIEAMATEVPVVATDRGGPAEVIEDGVTGRLVPIGDGAALGAAAAALLGDPEGAARMGRAARAAVSERFSTPAYVARVLAAYAAVAG